MKEVLKPLWIGRQNGLRSVPSLGLVAVARYEVTGDTGNI